MKNNFIHYFLNWGNKRKKNCKKRKTEITLILTFENCEGRNTIIIKAFIHYFLTEEIKEKNGRKVK